MASGLVTKEIESRLKESPEHIFEVFLEIHQPIQNETAQILIKYPNDFADQILKTAPNFAYPYSIPCADQNENFTFVVLDSNGLTFRFGHCRRSNRESTCLCLISYYPWFDIFYKILNDLSQIINSKSETEVERFLSALYHYKLMSIKEFYQNKGQELIKITNLYKYSRPDHRRLPSMLSNFNYTVLFSQLNAHLILRLFAHLIFERRILFVSSKLFHLTACACGCLHLIHPMHWQGIFLPILPESMTWTTQCTAPYIIGIHSSIYSKLNRKELGDVVIVNIDERTIQSEYEDLNLFPKSLIRQMRKDIEQAVGDGLARVFLRTMAFLIGNYANGFVIKNDKLDFDRSVYLGQYRGSDLYKLMSTVADTQIFEQFSRYRASLQLESETDIDEFDIEVKNLQSSRKTKSNKTFSQMLEKTANPLFEQLQHQAEKIQTAIQKTGHKVVEEMTNNLASVDIKSSPKSTQPKNNSLIDFESNEDPVLPPPVDSKVKQIQSELPYQLQTFDDESLNPGDERKAMKQLVQQFDPLNDPTSILSRSEINDISDRHPSLSETIPVNCMNDVLRNLQMNSGANTQMNLREVSPLSSDHLYPSLPSNDSNLIDFNQ